MFLPLLLFGHVLVVLTQSFNCPRDPLDPNSCVGGHYPNIYNCSQFYQCDTACIDTVRNCPPGLHFNNQTKICDWPWSANCRAVTTVAPPTTTGAPVTPQQTTAPAFTTPIPGPIPITAVAFKAYLENDRYTDLTPVTYDGVSPNLNVHFRDLQRLDVPQDGIYWFSLSAGCLPETGLDFALLVNGIRVVSIKRESTDHREADTTSRDFVRRLVDGQTVNTYTVTGGMYSDAERQTSFSAFGLSEMAGRGNEVAFMAAMTAPLSGPQNPVQFDTIVINEGNGLFGSVFIAPSDGLYYFQISVGHNAGNQVNFDMQINNTPYVDLYRNSTTHDGIDTTSRGIMAQLNEGDTVHMVNNDDSSTNSDAEYLTSFSGFRYQVAWGQPVAWSVARTNTWTGDDSAMYPVEYDRILVNVGPTLPWDVQENSVIAPSSGLYFLHLSTGTHPKYGVNYSLTLNFGIFVDILRSSNHQNGHDVISRSAIAYLTAGDILQVGASQGTAMWATSQMQTSFTGFLVYQDQ